mgnify:CR=1 FL=1
MATGWSVLDALNKSSKAAAEDKPKARFRTRDISIRKMYSNERNFYSMTDIEELAQQIMAVGLIENLTVTFEPCEAGEYRIIAGERRWRALNLLLEKGHEEFEMATCQIKTPAEGHEETVQLIIANAYRNKTVVDMLEEEKRLKESLQYMKDNGLTLQGYKLDSGRLRDIIADIMNTTATKIAQIESINKRLIPEFAEELKEGRLTFSAAYEISGMPEEAQQQMLEKHGENGLTLKDVREVKKGAGTDAEEPGIQQEAGTPQFPELDMPDEKIHQYMDDFAEYFISSNIEWIQADHENRALHVGSIPGEIKTYLGQDERVLYFKSGSESLPELMHICLHDGYVQMCTGTDTVLGNFDWFYLAAAIQRKWQTVLVEMANGGKRTEPAGEGMVKEGHMVMQEEDISKEKEEWQQAHPESITSLCYSCKRYSDCNVKTSTCRGCDRYINKAETEKTAEQCYNEEQNAIDRETAKRLRETEQEEKLRQLPSKTGKQHPMAHQIKLGSEFFDDAASGRKDFELRKNDRDYRVGDILEMMEFKDGRNTGRICRKAVTYILEDFTGLEDGYCIMGCKVISEAGNGAAQEAAEDAAQQLMQYGA